MPAPSHSLLALAIGLGALALCAPARADDLSDFEAARRQYEEGEYASAVESFEAMVGGEVPRVRNELLVLESRKYLAVSYLFIDRVPAAEAQFEALLRQDPTYQLDPVAFPGTVYETFRRVGDRVREAEARATAEREAEERARRDRTVAQLLAQQERIARLEALARERIVERENSRGLAVVPFGVGQFRNGHKGFGAFLAASQSVFLLGSIVTFSLHERMLRLGPRDLPARVFERRERSYRAANITGVTAFVALLTVGLIDAQLRFRPVITSIEERELPEPSVDLQVGLGRVDFSLRF